MSNVKGPDNAQDRSRRLEELVDRYQEQVTRMCFLYLCDKTMAEDAVQETFLKAYIHLDRLQDPSKEKSWLTKIAVNICRDHLRSPWVTHMNRYVQPEDLRIAAEQENETHTALTAAVMNLPPEVYGSDHTAVYTGLWDTGNSRHSRNNTFRCIKKMQPCLRQTQT